MDKNFTLLVSNVLSKYDLLETDIFKIYIQKALQSVTNKNYYVLDMYNDTPFKIYKEFVITNSEKKLIDPSTDTFSFEKQTTVLIIGFSSVCFAHLDNVDYLYVNGNGPVTNPASSLIIGLGEAMGKKVVYFKDDARHLFGYGDEPLTMGLLPNVSTNISYTPSLTRINQFLSTKTDFCGLNNLIQRTREAAKNPDKDIKISDHVANLIQLGKKIISKFMETSTSFLDEDSNKVYRNIYSTIQENRNLISKIDSEYLFTQFNIPRFAKKTFI